MDAFITGLAVHLPEQIVTNDDLQRENPGWDMPRVEAKTGIRQRHIAARGECASDLGFAAADKLLRGMEVDRSSIDCVLLCTQSPDYVLPTTACLLQDRLGLSTRCAALDFNQGCSGFVYGLYLAKALVASGMARKILLITAETYSKLIHPQDRSVRVLFGDGASACLVTNDSRGARIGTCVMGTDGSGCENLIVPAGGGRQPWSAETGRETKDDQGSVRSANNLYMNGQELFLFTLQRVPEVVSATLAASSTTMQDIDHFVFHQANEFMNEHLRAKLSIPREKAPIVMQGCGNTVSSTIPIALHSIGTDGKLRSGQKVMLVGFGVGYSWGACLVTWGDGTHLA